MFSHRRHSIPQVIWAFLVSVAFLAGVLPTSGVESPSNEGPTVKWMGGNGLIVPVDPKRSALSTTCPLPTDDFHVVLVQSAATELGRVGQTMTTSEWHLTRRMRLSISPGHSPPVA